MCVCCALLLQVSEGIDFSDKAGRGVVITGKPSAATCTLAATPCAQLLVPHSCRHPVAAESKNNFQHLARPPGKNENREGETQLLDQEQP